MDSVLRTATLYRGVISQDCTGKKRTIKIHSCLIKFVENVFGMFAHPKSPFHTFIFTQLENMLSCLLQLSTVVSQQRMVVTMIKRANRTSTTTL